MLRSPSCNVDRVIPSRSALCRLPMFRSPKEAVQRMTEVLAVEASSPIRCVWTVVGRRRRKSLLRAQKHRTARIINLFVCR